MPLPEFKQLVEWAKSEINEVSLDQLEQMRSQGEDVSVIDVREREDATNGMIPGAVNIPRGMLELNIDQITTDKNKKVVLYCGGGSRSALAAWMLQKMGFCNVFSLAGGFKGWKNRQDS